MMEKEIRGMFEKISLSEQEKGNLWEQITERHQEKKKKKYRLVPAAAVLFLLFAGIVYTASSENMIQAMKALFGQKQEHKPEPEISADDGIIQDLWEYSYYDGSAPKILLYTKKQLVFANAAGLAVYDLETDRAAFTVNLQELGCSYIELGNSLGTGCLPEGNKLIIFNETDGVVEDCYYILDLENFGIKKRDFKEYGEKEKAEKRKLYKEWRKFEKEHYQDLGGLNAFHKEVNRTKNAYNYFAYIRDEDGRKTASSLCISNLWNGKKQSFSVITKDLADGTVVRERTLKLPQMPEIKDELPEFVYRGKDPVEKAVCSYFEEEAEKEKGGVKIPMPVIYGIREKKSSVLVFLSMAYKTYYKNGMVLEENGGGRQAMRITLKKRNGDWQVMECFKAADGAGHLKSIEEFTKGYPKIRKRYFADRLFEKKLKKKKQEMLKMYKEQLDGETVYVRNSKGRLKKM